MRNMSFMLTKQQIRDRTKTVTRRMGWLKLRPGDLLCAVEKGMGLKPGERVERIDTIRVVDVRQEPLKAMLEDVDYGMAECVKEGFGDHHTLRWPSEFVVFFCGSHKGCTPESLVTRIEFEYVEG
ncbi:MAG: hypothetical protein EPN61_18540 [Burkholderiaceae bacterium]|nr:MAG: hypothetical protein EPN61_18540 [Burkholderiaceae bacterium]